MKIALSNNEKKVLKGLKEFIFIFISQLPIWIAIGLQEIRPDQFFSGIFAIQIILVLTGLYLWKKLT